MVAVLVKHCHGTAVPSVTLGARSIAGMLQNTQTGEPSSAHWDTMDHGKDKGRREECPRPWGATTITPTPRDAGRLHRGAGRCKKGFGPARGSGGRERLPGGRGSHGWDGPIPNHRHGEAPPGDRGTGCFGGQVRWQHLSPPLQNFSASPHPTRPPPSAQPKGDVKKNLARGFHGFSCVQIDPGKAPTTRTKVPDKADLAEVQVCARPAFPAPQLAGSFRSAPQGWGPTKLRENLCFFFLFPREQLLPRSSAHEQAIRNPSRNTQQLFVAGSLAASAG